MVVLIRKKHFLEATEDFTKIAINAMVFKAFRAFITKQTDLLVVECFYSVCSSQVDH
jgi:hypothetical protein